MNKTKKGNSVHLLQMEKIGRGWRKKRCSDWIFLFFRERESSFSLDLRPFGPSVLDGARSKVDLHGEGYAWTPIWWSSDNSKR